MQLVQITREGISVAGHEFMLICRASRDALLSALLEMEWLGPRGTLIEEDSGVTIMGSSTTTKAILTNTLVFSNLHTSQGGLYTCRMNLTIPEENVTDHSVSKSSNVIVQRKY